MSTANESQIKCLTLPWSKQARQNYVLFDEFSSLLNCFYLTSPQLTKITGPKFQLLRQNFLVI